MVSGVVPNSLDQVPVYGSLGVNYNWFMIKHDPSLSLDIQGVQHQAESEQVARSNEATTNGTTVARNSVITASIFSRISTADWIKVTPGAVLSLNLSHALQRATKSLQLLLHEHLAAEA